MNFDIKDIKSWANRHDVKIGDRGYVSNDLDILRDDLKSSIAQIRIISHVGDNDAYCFSAKAFGTTRNYGFFLPTEAVIEDPKEKKMNKKYRPFKTYDEFNDFLDTCSYLRETYISFRNKKTHHIYNDLIFSVSYDVEGELFSINRFSVQELFDNFEIYKFGEWVPFGVEVKND